jgi:DNA-binding CsgD family transcriptional regulator
MTRLLSFSAHCGASRWSSAPAACPGSAGSVPVPLTQRRHDSGQQHGADHRRVDQHGDGEPVRRVGEGGSVLDPAVVSQLVSRPRRRSDPLEQLTDREREVLALMAEGRSNKAIAERLFVTEHTVEKHVKNIFAMLRLPPSAEDHRRVLAVLTFLNGQ